MLPCLRATLRCFTHAGQSTLENSLKSDPCIDRLLHTLIFKHGDEHDRGSLARGLKCHKVRRMFREEVAKDLGAIPELAGSLTSANFAQQRFDSILEILRLLVLRLDDVLRMLCRMATATDKDSSTWAHNMLAVWALDKRRTSMLLPCTATGADSGL